jgi:hypothetical protein
MAPTFHEAFDRLKEQGKVRFLGVSSHTPNLEAVMRHAVQSGRFHMLLVAHNFSNWPDLKTIFHDAKQRGVGVVAGLGNGHGQLYYAPPVSSTGHTYPQWLGNYYGLGFGLVYNDIWNYFKPGSGVTTSADDLNLDCVVDIQDLMALLPYYGMTPTPNSAGTWADLFDSTPRVVDIFDFVAIAKHFGPVDP